MLLARRFNLIFIVNRSLTTRPRETAGFIIWFSKSRIYRLDYIFVIQECS